MSEEIETGGPAFPTPRYERGDMYSLGMTLRQYAAIKLKVPDSGTEWLDEMIRESLKDDFAAKAMQVFLTNERSTMDVDAIAAYEMADEMLKAKQR